MASLPQLGPIAGLAAATVTPLVLTTAPHQPIALAAGCGLAMALARLTIDPPSAAASNVDAEKEAAAIRNVVMTSDTNRLVRLLLGSIYIYASTTFALRMTDGAQLLSRLANVEPAAVGRLLLVWAGCMIGATLGVIYWAVQWLNPHLFGLTMLPFPRCAR